MTREVYTHVTAPMFDATAAVIEQAMNDLNGSKGGSNDERRPGGTVVMSADQGPDLQLCRWAIEDLNL
jgi:hypothetical protein